MGSIIVVYSLFYTQLSFLGIQNALLSYPRAVLPLQPRWGLPLSRSGCLSDPVTLRRCCSSFIMQHTSSAVSLTLQQADAQCSARSRFQAGRKGLVFVCGKANRATRRDRRHRARAACQRHCELQFSSSPLRYGKTQICLLGNSN